MAKFIKLTVGSADRIFSAENVITTARTLATETVITYNNVSGYTTCTITHDSDAATDKVVNAVNDAIIAAHGNSKRPDVVIDVVLPVAVSGVLFT
jgi:hypothetical protein